MFQLADRFDSSKKGYKSKLTRIYVYRWWGEPGTFDSGLVNPTVRRAPRSSSSRSTPRAA